jgi:hypothetical protein
VPVRARFGLFSAHLTRSLSHHARIKAKASGRAETSDTGVSKVSDRTVDRRTLQTGQQKAPPENPRHGNQQAPVRSMFVAPSAPVEAGAQ